MTDDRLRDEDIVQRLIDGRADDELEPLAGVLRTLRDGATAEPIEPDHRLADLFDTDHAVVPEPARRPWRQRPAVAFAAAFAAVLLFGAAALALVNRGPADPESETAAATTTEPASTTVASTDPVVGTATSVTIPETVDESVGDYLRCALGEVGGYLQRRLGDPVFLDRPRILAECGLPAIPSLGPEAESFRVALNEWLACAAEEFDAAIPRLLEDPGAIDDPLEKCGNPPNPADFGITFDLDGLRDRFSLDDLDLPDLRLPDIDLRDLLEGLPGELRERIPDDLNLEGLTDLRFHLRDEGVLPFGLGDGEFPFDEFPLLELDELLRDIGSLDTSSLDEFVERLRNRGFDVEVDEQALREALESLASVSEELASELCAGLRDFGVPGVCE